MAYGLILTGGTPDSIASMRAFIDKVSQNFRKLEATLGGAAGDGADVVANIACDAEGYHHVMTFTNGLLTSYSVTRTQPIGITRGFSFTDADGVVHTVNIETGLITTWDSVAP
jgi:hypothetical protein